MAVSDREVVSSRRFEAPRELVWKAWTEPGHLANWWGPKGFRNTFRRFDLRPGGEWEFTMHGPDGTDYPNRIVFVEIAPPERLVFDHVSGHRFRVTATFAAEGSGTRVTFQMRFDSAEELGRVRELVTQGNEQNFDRLEGELLAMQAAPNEIVIARMLDAPRQLVWKAITEPAHSSRWWGPDGFRIEGMTMDLRTGGVWAFDMVGPDGTRYPNHSVFREIVPHSRLVFDHGDGQRKWFEASIILQERGASTLIVLRQVYPSKEARDEVAEKYGAIEGGKQHLAKLEAYVKEILS